MADEVAAEVGFAVLTVHADDPSNSFGLALPVGDPATLPPPPAHLAPADLPVRWIYYSSGTTSDPKGGRHTDQSVMAGASGVLGSMGVRPDDVVPMPFPIAHIGGICMLTTALVSRCTALLVEAFDMERSPLVFAEHGASLLGSAVPFFHAYLAAQRKHGPEPLYPAYPCLHQRRRAQAARTALRDPTRARRARHRVELGSHRVPHRHVLHVRRQ